MIVKLADVYRSGHAERASVAFLYQLLRERPLEANISHRGMPSFAAHQEFVCKRRYRAWFLVLNEHGEQVGAIYATHANEIGIFIARPHQRRGYGRAAIQALRATLEPRATVDGRPGGRWLAHVAPNNAPSHALFRGLGARPIEVTYELP